MILGYEKIFLPNFNHFHIICTDGFFLDFDSLIYKIVNNLVNKPPRNFSKIQFLGVVIYLVLGVSFSIGGYYCAKRKNRNVWIWAIACFLWNLWAYLLILCLPSRKL